MDFSTPTVNVPIRTTKANIRKWKEHHLAKLPHKISDWAVGKLVRRIARKIPLLKKKHAETYLKFATELLEKPVDYWE